MTKEEFSSFVKVLQLHFPYNFKDTDATVAAFAPILAKYDYTKACKAVPVFIEQNRKVRLSYPPAPEDIEEIILYPCGSKLMHDSIIKLHEKAIKEGWLEEN